MVLIADLKQMDHRVTNFNLFQNFQLSVSIYLTLILKYYLKYYYFLCFSWFKILLFFMFFLIFCEAAAGTIPAPYYNVRLKCTIGDWHHVVLNVLLGLSMIIWFIHVSSLKYFHKGLRYTMWCNDGHLPFLVFKKPQILGKGRPQEHE